MLLALAALLLASLVQPAPAPVTLGVDVLLTERAELVAGKRVGLVTNASGVDGQLVATADRLHRDPRVTLARLFAPEHGLRGALPAGRRVADERDPATGVPVTGLFGKRRRPDAASLKGVDVLVFDIQDVGSRTYTFVSTLGEVMKSCAQFGVPLVVLDRPNPLGGLVFEGPVVRPEHRSFIGWGPLPVTHGMTVGELARFYNGELGLGCDLEVVVMKGWRRAMTWRDTGLHWVPTSPGIPVADSPFHYVATGMVGGISKNVNEGVGTTLPFALVGATFVDAAAFADALAEARLPGAAFRPTTFVPYYHRFAKQTLHGVQLVVTDPLAFRPIRTALTLLTTLERLYPGQHALRADAAVARVWGTPEVLAAVRRGRSAGEIEAGWRDELAAFGERRARYLLYP